MGYFIDEYDAVVSKRSPRRFHPCNNVSEVAVRSITDDWSWLDLRTDECNLLLSCHI